MADALANALTQHDKVRRSTDIPLFYGRSDKDTITPNQLIERIERAARVANWNNDERRCDEFFLCLREKAISWFNTLDNIAGFDKKNWNDVKTEFLEAYATKYTAKTLVTCFQDLKQKADENVQDFYNRVSDVFRDAYLVKPDHVITFAGPDADRLGLTLAQVNGFLKIGIENMQRLMMNTVFLGGLKEEIRLKVLETGPTQIRDSVRLARDLEVIFKDKKEKQEKGAYVHAVKHDDESDPEDEVEIDQDDVSHFKAINAIRKRNGQTSLRFRVRPGGRSGSGVDKSKIKCRYCKIMGHYQKECRKRINANAPEVDAAGKPLTGRPGPPQQPQYGVHTVNGPQPYYYGSTLPPNHY